MGEKMIPVKRIYVTRAEGRIDECGVSHVCDSFGEANAVLRMMARTAPSTGGYDKCDFLVIYADGETYEGRYDLTYDDVFGASIGEHMKSHVTFSAGLRMPPRFIERYGAEGAKERYEIYLREIVKPEGVEAYKKFLETYMMEDGVR